MPASRICHSAICGSWSRNQRKADCSCGNAARRATSWMEGATSTVSGREPGAMRAKQPYYNGGRVAGVPAQLCGAGALARERSLDNPWGDPQPAIVFRSAYQFSSDWILTDVFEFLFQ